jgi:anaerobic C4-dicarboxylate transporter
VDWLVFAVELAVVLVCIALGARQGGIALGFWGGLGMVIIVMVFREPASDPPMDVMLIILSVICATATMQAAGGIDYLVGIAARIIRRHPDRITFIGPLVAWLFTVCAGTGHILYPLLPVIHDTAVRNGVRPERPMSVAVIGSLLGITASPVSAATAALIVVMEPRGVTMPQVLSISIPATLIGLFCASLAMMRWGRELEDDPEYQRRLAAGEVSDIPQYVRLRRRAKREKTTIQELARREGITDLEVEDNAALALVERRKDAEHVAEVERENDARPGSGRISAIIFMITVVLVVVFGTFSGIRPLDGEGKPMSMAVLIQMIMLACAAIIAIVTKVKVAVIPATSIAKTGLVAIVGIFGLAWLGSTVIEAHTDTIVPAMSALTSQHPWLFAVVLFAGAILLFSQATTTRALMPLGVSLGIASPSLIAMWPAVNGAFFLPTYGTIVAALNFDRSGTSKIGRFVLNHSYMVPGLVGVFCSVVAGFGVVGIFY